MNRMDRLASWIDPAEVPAALRLLAMMEAYGQIPHAEAVEWREKIVGWASYRAMSGDEPPRA
jgi:hypothetical protein